MNVDWSPWFRKAILESARQVRGAERWLKEHPDRVFVDHKCAQRLPLALDHIAQCQFHRVIVALGAQERCRRHLGGSGSLAPEISGKSHYDPHHGPIEPFCVGKIPTSVSCVKNA